MTGLIWIKTGIFETLFEKVYFETDQQMTKKHSKFACIQRV